MLWVLFALLSGFFSTTADAFAKKVNLDDDYIIVWSRFFFGFPIFLISLFFVSIPSLDWVFWVTILLIMPLEIILFVLYIKAIRMSPLSLTLPFFSLTPIFLIITSFIFLGELPNLIGVLGILLIVIGAYTLNLSDKKYGILGPFRVIFKEKGIILIILAAFVASINSNLGKIAILHSNTLFFFVIFSFMLTLLLSIMFFGRVKNKIKAVKSNIFMLSLIGIFNGLMMLFHVLAITLVIVPFMISLKRTSAIFGVLYGHFWFKEKHIKERLVGAAIMLVGAGLIILS